MTTRTTGGSPRAISGSPTSTSRPLVFVSRPLWAHFHKRWRDINREWLGGGIVDPDVLSAAMTGVRAAREKLREEVRALAPSFGGSYLIPL